MLRISALLFASGILFLFIGIKNWAGLSFEMGRLWMFILIGAAILLFVVALIPARRNRSLPTDA